MPSRIKHISYYLPEKIFSNKDYFQLFPEAKANENLDKIGVKNRRIVENELASDIAVKAAEKLFFEHNVSPSEIDFIIFCAQEFDYYTPTTACIIQNRLNIPTHAGAFDYNLGCSGFVYGLSISKGLIESVGIKNVLLLTSSTLTKTFHPKDKSSRFIFGDGAAATLISATSKEKGIGDFIFGTDGTGYDKIILKDGGARNPLTTTSTIEKMDDYGNTHSDSCFFMNGTSIFVFGIKTVPKIINELLQKSKLQKEDIDLFIFHQANKFLLETLQRKLEISDDKFYIHMENIGNTVSSTIPIALYEATKEGRIKEGQKVLLVAFGVGLSWAGTIITV
jgi:3-oxoacyl-[acyl-carrier-protein] synthase III